MAILRMIRCSQPGRPPPGHRARRPVTVLCIDLQTASSFGRGTGPRGRRGRDRPAAAGLAPVLERYGGKLVISASERLMGVFGVATLHEDDALRAARASLEAREALTAEAAMLLSDHGANLICRFGLATGEALVGGSGPLGSPGT